MVRSAHLCALAHEGRTPLRPQHVSIVEEAVVGRVPRHHGVHRWSVLSHKLAGELGCRTHDRARHQMHLDLGVVVVRKGAGHEVLDGVRMTEHVDRGLGRKLRAGVKVGELQLVRFFTAKGVGDAVAVSVAIGSCAPARTRSRSSNRGREWET